jgi:hypothetical protein
LVTVTSTIPGATDVRAEVNYIWNPLAVEESSLAFVTEAEGSIVPQDEVTVTAVTMERGAGGIRHDTTGYPYNPPIGGISIRT